MGGGKAWREGGGASLHYLLSLCSALSCLSVCLLWCMWEEEEGGGGSLGAAETWQTASRGEKRQLRVIWHQLMALRLAKTSSACANMRRERIRDIGTSQLWNLGWRGDISTAVWACISGAKTHRSPHIAAGRGDFEMAWRNESLKKQAV